MSNVAKYVNVEDAPRTAIFLFNTSPRSVEHAVGAASSGQSKKGTNRRRAESNHDAAQSLSREEGAERLTRGVHGGGGLSLILVPFFAKKRPRS